MNYKLVNEFKKKNGSNSSKKLKIINKLLVVIVFLLTTMIVLKIDKNNNQVIYKYFKEKNINFAFFNNLYNKYIGSIFAYNKNKEEDNSLVFGENLQYREVSSYQDGCELTVADKYLISNLEGGVVVFIGEKELYGNTIIVQQVNGVDAWYGNVENIKVDLYDYVSKNEILANVISNKLYLAFKKDGEFLNYKDYL